MISALNRLVALVEEHLNEETDVHGLVTARDATVYHYRRTPLVEGTNDSVAPGTPRVRCWPRLACGAVPIAGVLLLAGCQAGQLPGLRAPGSMVRGTATQPHVAPDRPVSFGSIIVCGSSRHVTVTDVTLTSSTGGLRVSGFAIRPNPSSTGGAPVGIVDESLTGPLIGVESVGPGLAAPCDATGAGGSEVLVEVQRAGRDDGCAAGGIDLHYVSGSDPAEAMLHIPLALAVGEGDAPCT